MILIKVGKIYMKNFCSCKIMRLLRRFTPRKDSSCHSEQSERIARLFNNMRLLRRFTPRNDSSCHSEQSERIARLSKNMRLLRRFTPRNDSSCHSEQSERIARLSNKMRLLCRFTPRNDSSCHSEQSERIARLSSNMRLLRRFTPRNDSSCHSEQSERIARLSKNMRLLRRFTPRNDSLSILNKKRKGVSVILLMFSLIAIFSLAGLIVDLGILLNTRYEFQKLLETSALAAVADYNAYEGTGADLNKIMYPPVANISTNVNSIVNNNLNAFIASNSFLLISKNITPEITFGTTIQSRYSRAIKITATADVKTYFLTLIGIRSIKILGSAAAMNVPVYLKNGNILNGTWPGTVPPSYKDTDIRNPAGGASSIKSLNGENYTLPAITNINATFSNIYGFPEGRVLSLGPGGYITIKLPATLVDGRGFDLQIITRGTATGYFVFAGNDTNPANPYVSATSPGGGIAWVNISCTGTPVGNSTNGTVGSYNQTCTALPVGQQVQPKFYGSGYFDIGASCSSGYAGNVHTAKYLKIIDDNLEDGFILNDPEVYANMTAIPSYFAGQNSSYTPGVSIDAIAVEHHPRLISTSDFAKDTDADGLIDVFEQTLGLGPCGPSDGTQNCGTPPASDDALEYWGYQNTGRNNIVQDNPMTALRIDYPSRSDNPPKMYVNY